MGKQHHHFMQWRVISSERSGGGGGNGSPTKYFLTPESGRKYLATFPFPLPLSPLIVVDVDVVVGHPEFLSAVNFVTIVQSGRGRGR